MYHSYACLLHFLYLQVYTTGMLIIILVILIILFLTGSIHISGFTIPHTVLFNLNGHPITLINTLIFLAIAIGVLPSPFREIAGVLFILWLLSILGFIAIAGLSTLLVLAIIVGIILSVIGI